ncbi:hypothetical protein C1646_812643 [Rhizophagus diaphanus]|nr:hypothetical protein C1646_812643 [Rhizophagus diaphanus] [Rhizophagus sp. MUCL 43196]
MPAKISTMCYIHEFTKHLTQEFTVKEITAVARLDDDDLKKIVYLRVNATSIKLIDNMGFNDMPVIGLNVMIMGLTTKSIRNIDNQLVIEFYVEENLGDWEPREFWVEVHYNLNLRYLANKTNSINQSMRSTTALIMGTLTYEIPVLDEISGEEIISRKAHINIR